MRFWRKIFFVAVITILFLNQEAFLVLAEGTGQDIQAINDEISLRRLKIEQISEQINAYRSKITRAEAAQTSLQNEVELLDNRVAQSELEIEVATEEINNLDAEMRVTDTNIATAEITLRHEKELITSVLREIRSLDEISIMEWLLSSGSFSELTQKLEELESVHNDLNQTLNKVASAKENLQVFKEEQEIQMVSLENVKKELESKAKLLEEQKNAKISLIAETAESEAEFQSLLNELLAEEQYVNRQINALQDSVEQKLLEGDLSGDTSALSWPFYPEKGISATFHDPTYPFRHLFEHPGIDLPASVGTSVKSVAPGYVAWVREGRMYGYYVLVIHANGIASLYAHLSKILVDTDQYVARGETIGLSGGRPGSPGAGLSTGPHLHFEVRKDGIPVNPLNYLVSY